MNPLPPAARAPLRRGDTVRALEVRVVREAKQSDEFGRFVERSVEEIRSAVTDERAQHAAMVTCQPKLAELAQLRGILVEGIVKNQFAFALDVHTTSLAVKFLDRFLGADRFAVQASQGWIYHLVANACQTIAVKFQVRERATTARARRTLSPALTTDTTRTPLPSPLLGCPPSLSTRSPVESTATRSRNT